MIEKTILDYIKKNIDVPVYMEVPKNPPKRFIVIEKTGGSEENLIYTSTFAVQSYAESKYQAAALNDEIKGMMLDKEADIPDVSAIDYGGDYDYTDDTTKQYRYQLVLIITHY